jgi:hypothetical protein
MERIAVHLISTHMKNLRGLQDNHRPYRDNPV